MGPDVEQMNFEKPADAQSRAGEAGANLTDVLAANAARWRWLASDCDGNAQDDFIRWLAGHVASKSEIDERIDAFRVSIKAANAELRGDE